MSARAFHRRRTWVAAAALLLFAGTLVWGAYLRFFAERANPSLKEYPIRGVDISAHNGAIDFARLPRQSVRFAYVKATEGADFLDRRFIYNATMLSRHDIPAGAYHFFRFDTDGAMQAWNFIRAIEGRNFALPPAIDVEQWGNPGGHSPRAVRNELRRMLRVMHSAGFDTIMLYSNKKGYNRFLRGYFDDYPLWICSFTDPPIDPPAKLPDSVAPWSMWQFSHRGTLPGIPSAVDLNTIHPLHPLAERVKPKQR